MERRHQDTTLKRGILRLAQRTAKWERNPEATWRLRLFHVRADETDDNGRYPPTFDHVGERAHGARAEWSDRAEQDRVDLLLL
jgi:hypothetical protein